MNYQNAVLPKGATYVSESPRMTEISVLPPILHKHMAPKGKYGLLVVETGTVQLEWEDSGEIFDADNLHPIVIFPERYHHVKLNGPVSFRIEFYLAPAEGKKDSLQKDAIRPGEQFLPGEKEK